MNRRTVLTAAVTACSAGLAGCGGSGEAGDAGEIVGLGVEGLTITDHDGGEDDTEYEIVLDVKNTGNRTADLQNYDFVHTVYDEDGEAISHSGTVVSHERTELPSGETTEVEIEFETPEFGSDVERYEVELSCSTFAENAAYCDG